MSRMSVWTRNLAVASLAAVLVACGGESPDDLADVEVSWAASPHSAVNSAGGGYRVYYSQQENFQPGDPGVMMKEVPFDGGAQAPTSTVIEGLWVGEWFFRVQAFADLSPPDSVNLPDPAVSELTDPVSVTVER